MPQQGLLLRASDHRAEELAGVPTPPSDHNAIQPSAYASLLPGADPQHLLLAAVPLGEAAGCRIVLVYDASRSGPPNSIATRLTTSLDRDRLEVQIRGDALAFYAHPGADLHLADWQQLDNAIYSELADPDTDVHAVLDDLKAGRYDYSKHHAGEESEDANKDDAGQDLQDALGESRGVGVV